MSVFRDGLWGGPLLAAPDVLSNSTFTPLEIAENAGQLALRHRPTYLLPSTMISIGAMLLVGGTLVAGVGSRHRELEIRDRG